MGQHRKPSIGAPDRPCRVCGAIAEWKAWQIQNYDFECARCRIARKPHKERTGYGRRDYFGKSQEECFLDRVEPVTMSGCWIWMGSIGRVGYRPSQETRPYFSFNGHLRYAHRVSYELFTGPIPDGKIICHKCDVPLCVNPEHLYAGTPADNARDCAARGRNTAQRNPEAARLRGVALGRSGLGIAAQRRLREMKNAN